MSAAIGPGDWVESLEDVDAPDGTFVRRGKLYCVTDTGERGCAAVCCDRREWIDLAGQPVTDLAWCPCAFRPIYRPKAELLESLKAPPKSAKPKPVKVEA